MKLRILLCTAIALLLSLPTGAQELGGELLDDERAQLIELLESSRSETEAMAAQATCENWNKKPAEDSWSVGEVIEHIVIAEEGIFATAVGALDTPEDPDWQEMAAKGDVSALVTQFKDRSQKFQAPDPFQPKGEMDRDELVRRFGAVRAATLDFVRRSQEPIKRHTATGPPGKMNVHQWLALIAGHNLRHNLQIAEVLETVGDC